MAAFKKKSVSNCIPKLSQDKMVNCHTRKQCSLQQPNQGVEVDPIPRWGVTSQPVAFLLPRTLSSQSANLLMGLQLLEGRPNEVDALSLAIRIMAKSRILDAGGVPGRGRECEGRDGDGAGDRGAHCQGSAAVEAGACERTLVHVTSPMHPLCGCICIYMVMYIATKR